MPTCDNCGANEFESFDGLYYCALCQTQSQDVRDIEADDEFIFNPSLSISTTKPRQETEKKTVDKGRPWTTHEAFQVIIHEQVKALIKLGADPELENVIFKLWVLYLAKNGIAFFNKTSEMFSTPATSRIRDKYFRSVDDPLVKDVKRLKKVTKLKKLEKSREAENSSVSQEQFYEEDDPNISEDDSLLDELLDSSSESDDTKNKRKSSVNPQSRKQVDRMSMKLTICFCYLGLQYTNNLTTAADLARWIDSGDVPYKNAVSKLPEDMKFGLYDYATFSHVDTPSTENIKLVTGKLALFLGLKDIPGSNIYQLASRFVLELNLPGEIHGLLRNFFHDHITDLKHTPSKHEKTLPNYEGIAMAYIIILLKLVLGLDDYTEKQLSKYGRELSEKVQLHQQLFIWDDWMRYMEKRSRCSSRVYLPEHVDDAQSISDITPALDHHKNVLSQRHRFSSHRSRLINKSIRPETRENLQKCLSGVLEKLKLEKNLQSSVSKTQDDFVLLDNPMDVLVDSDNEAESSNENNPEKTRDTCSNEDCDFSSHTLAYIVLEDLFLDQLESQGLSDYTVQSSCASSADSDSDHDFNEEDEERDFATGDLMPKKKKHYNSAISEIIKQTLTPSKRNRTKKPAKRETVQELMKSALRGYERYVIYTRAKTYDEGSKHKSYNWLLAVCSEIIGCPKHALESEIERLELVYFAVKENLGFSAQIRRTNILKKYFHQSVQ